MSCSEYLQYIMLQCGKKYLLIYAPCEDSDQPAYPHSLSRVFVVHMQIASLAIQNAPSEESEQTLNVQADLNIHRAHMSEDMLSDIESHMHLCRQSHFWPWKCQENLCLKMSSVYVLCWIFLQTFQTYFCIQANSVDPDQTAGAVWSGSTLFAKMTFKITSRWQSRRQLLWLAV